MNKVKLVIWDLDETFWTGTLSEGAVKNPHVELVKRLATHGIVNSISSKNDFEQAKKKLEEFGVWGYFVFPSINWNPKGEAVKGIISDSQLRNPNVVFIDDNPSNINEVVFYNPDIMTYSSPEDFEKDLCWDEYKEDKDLKRLKQYHLLEEKKEYRNECADNKDFLFKSNIRIQLITEIEPIKDRLIEMIERTNQLNYTKIRIGLHEMDSLINDKQLECVAVRVVDNFGDYGVCGFYAINKATNSLLHFLFSCRILNLGVENYIYQKLGRPHLNIVEPVSTELTEEPVSWIKEDDCMKVNIEQSVNKKIKIAMVGGCDLDQMCHYISGESFDVIKDFNYSNKRMNAVHREHTVFLKKAGCISRVEMNELVKLPFLDDQIFQLRFLSEDYDFLIFSPLMNYTQELYRHKTMGFEIAYGGYANILETSKPNGFSEEEFDSFKKDYEHIGQQTPEAFKEDLDWLLKVTDKRIIFINGAEYYHDNPKELGAFERHKAMNNVLSAFVNEHSNRCLILDVNQFAKTRGDFADNIRHYSRVVYINLAKELMRMLGDNNANVSKIVIAKYFARQLLSKFKKIAEKMIKK